MMRMMMTRWKKWLCNFCHKLINIIFYSLIRMKMTMMKKKKAMNLEISHIPLRVPQLEPQVVDKNQTNYRLKKASHAYYLKENQVC